MPTRIRLENQIFVLSLLSNLGASLRGQRNEIERELHQTIQNSLDSTRFKLLIGNWNVIWGPAVFQAPKSNLADNVIYVAEGRPRRSRPELVVAIAGTNSKSIFSWLFQNLWVMTRRRWPTGSPPNGARISQGTYNGLKVLKKIEPGPSLPGSGQRIRRFLAEKCNEPVNATIAGFSLGGALAPALALWLSDTQDQWNQEGNAALACQPSAGPTPGNSEFAAYYGSQLGDKTRRIYNPIDIVPNAWSTSDLEGIPGLYEPQIPPSRLIKKLARGAAGISRSGRYTHIEAPTRVLEGAVNTSRIRSGKSGFENFMAQAMYQHVNAYAGVLGVPSWLIEPLLSALGFGGRRQGASIAELRRLWEQQAESF